MPPTAPVSADNATVLLWVVGLLTGALGVAVLTLWRMMVTNAETCRGETKELHAKIDQMHEDRAVADAKQQSTLIEVITRNTQAMSELSKEIGSGIHRALSDHDTGRRRDG